MDEYPSSSETVEASQQWTPEKPEERVEAENKEQAAVSSSIPVIQEVIEWLAAQQQEHSDPSIIQGVTPSTKAEDVKFAVLLAQKMGAKFKEKQAEFEARFAKHLKPEGGANKA